MNLDLMSAQTMSRKKAQRELTVLMTIRKDLDFNMLRILFKTCSIVEMQLIQLKEYMISVRLKKYQKKINH